MLPRTVLSASAALAAFVFAVPGCTAVAQQAGGKDGAIAIPASPEGPRIHLTLAEAVSLALRDNRAIRSAYLQRIAQKFDLRVAEDRFAPRMSIASSYLARRANGSIANTAELTPVVSFAAPTGAQAAVTLANVRTVEGGGADASSSSVNFAVIQPLLRGGGVEAATAPVRIARIDERINVLHLKQTVSRTVTEVILAYRDFLKAREQVRLAGESLERSQRLLEVNRSLIESGRMAEIEVVQAEADVATQEFGVEEAANRLDAARLALLTSVAVSPRTDVVPADDLKAEPVRVDLDRALSIAYANQPEYLVQLLAIERARIGVSVAKNQRLWDLAAVGGGSLGRSRQGGDFSTRNHDRSTYGGLQLVVPLGDLSGEQGEVSATVSLRTAELALDDLRQQVERHTRDAVRNLETRWRQFELARRARDLAARKLEVEGEKLRVGRSSNFQVLSFENDLRVAENAHLDAQIAYLNALAVLDQQLGTTLDTWRISLDD